VGLWWEDYPPPPKAQRTTSARALRAVAVPDTQWKAPREFPNLSTAKIIGLDTETKDPMLRELGPGGVTGRGHIVGVSLAVDGASWYFPMRHEYAPQTSMNMDPAKVLQFVGDTLSRPVPIVGANLMYDLEMLRAEGVRRPAGALHDVQFAEPLLNEELKSYALEVLAQRHLGEGKDTPLLYQWCADSFGGRPVAHDQAANIWRSPPTLVGPYAEADARLPLQIIRKQKVILQEEGLWDLYRMECRLIPLLLDMRFKGVRIDVEKAEATAKWLRDQARLAQDTLGDVDVWSSQSLAYAFERAGVEYAKTDAGNPSFTKLWLEAQDADIARQVLRVRMFEKAANPFVESYLLQNQHHGIVHCQFHPLRSDEYGTVTGRFSSSNPNLQNIPARDPVIGPLLRGLFIPREGRRWRRFDYSQIEYRMLAHYAIGKGSEEVRRRYRDNPDTDYHDTTVEMIRDLADLIMDRKPAKNMNFGLVYGMGEEKTIRSLGVGLEKGKQLYDGYHRALPFVKETYKSAQRLAKRRGYIKTILGRRRRFDRMEADKFNEGAMQRAGVHVALNACLQGSAADIAKKAAVDCYEAGLFDVTGIPTLFVHDEFDFDEDQDTKRVQEAFAEVKRIMETCVPCKVPIIADVSWGANWGECK